MNVWEQDATTLAGLVRAGKVSACESLAAHIMRLERVDPLINGFTERTLARAKLEAARVDRRVAAGEEVGPLAGVPLVVKNLFDIEGVVTLAGSKILRGAAPARADAAVLARLSRAGAVLLGAVNMDEFAYGFVTENAHDGPTRNPHDLRRIAGGSSGGSAACVAAGLAPLALGSDTNGSVRVPAALCGVFGMKPTYGRLDRAGVFPFVDSFDHVGLFARSTADLAIAYDLSQDDNRTGPALARGIAGARVAVLEGWFAETVSTEMLAAVVEVAAALKAKARVTLPEAARARSAAFCISAFEGGQLHKRNLQERPDEFDPATRPRLLAGALQPAAIVYQAQRFRAWFKAQLEALFDEYDILLAPATPCTAPLIGQASLRIGDAEIPVRANLGMLTQPFSFVGVPVVSVPVAGAGLPRGVQVITAPGREGLGLAASAWLEKAGLLAAPVARMEGIDA